MGSCCITQEPSLAFCDHLECETGGVEVGEIYIYIYIYIYKHTHTHTHIYIYIYIITLSTKINIVKAMVFPVVMYGCESWTIQN